MNQTIMDPVEQLCPNCGFCCNGNLFGDVELQKSEDARRLAKLGLLLEARSRGKKAFAQPCACFDGRLCAIYAGRPQRCRTFECGLLQRVQAGRLEVARALKIIARSKAQVGRVGKMLRRFGADEPSLSLRQRYSQVMRAPMDLAGGADDSAARGKLMLAMERLMRQLGSEFLEPVVFKKPNK